MELKPTLILASTSPRRKDILLSLGITFKIETADINETPLPLEKPETYVKRLAFEKAEAVRKKTKTPSPFIILAADTTVCLEDKIFGKPDNEAQAFSFLNTLQGKIHTVLTGFCLINDTGKIIAHDYDTSRVHIKKLTTDEIQVYIQTGEPMDKAGAYALQGLGKKFVEKVEGDSFNVIGLPLEKIKKCFKNMKLL